ncbi:FMRFamide receptor-like [Lineus longissimus]|uniref:FMRFamide receptor-like n=1 Tax=Lineus longissimus TaxID=88925 RepID=UPI00315DF764
MPANPGLLESEMELNNTNMTMDEVPTLLSGLTTAFMDGVVSNITTPGARTTITEFVTTSKILLTSPETDTNVTVNVTADSTQTAYEEFYETARFVTGGVIIPIVCILGIISNTLTLIVLNQKNMHTSTNTYLSALAVADLIKLVNDTLYFVTVLLFRVKPKAGNILYGHLYPYAHFIFSLSTSISSWLTISVAVERYIMVCHATRARGICTIQRARVVSTSVFFVMSVIALPYAFRYRTIRVFDNTTNTSSYDVETTKMWENQIFVDSFNWIQNLLRSIIPIAILVVVNFKIIKALNRSRANNKKFSSRNRITIMLISVIVVFITCVTPDAIMSIVGAGYHDESNYLIKGIREITDMLLGVNAAINFVLYCGFNKGFRQNFVSLFFQRCIKEKIKEADDSHYRKLPDPSPNSNEPNSTTPTKETNSTRV